MSQCTTSLTAHRPSATRAGLLSQAEEIELGRRWREDGERSARDRLITANRGLVVTMARRLSGRGVPMDDLVAEGHVGLITAVDKFDPDAGCRFSTYASFWIRQSLSQAFSRATSRGTMTRSDRLALRALDRAENRFALRHGHRPSEPELAEVLSWTVDRVRTVCSFRSVHTVQESIERAATSEIAAATGIPAPDSFSDSARNRSRSSFSELLTSLTSDERRAIELRFGFEGGSARTVQAVSAAMSTTERDVRSLLADAVKKLSRRAARSGLGTSSRASEADDN